ncbi:MAG: dihydropteroate synthase [Spirochaetia bacterium]|nr:dihydropteroate synthase [Spirochaetia bacterium]
MQVWAILNLTSDSFYEKSRVKENKFIDFALKCINEGADVLDIGAESSRPFSKPVTWEEEWQRLEKPLKLLKKELGEQTFEKIISVDTYKPETARRTLDMGIKIINDIKGGQNLKMLNLVSSYQAKIVIMHSKGTPENMQIKPEYSDVTNEVLIFLKKQTKAAISAGINKENIIWDYGVGFGKTTSHNLSLIKNTSVFKKEGFLLLTGISRKSFIGEILNLPNPEARGFASGIIHTYLALQGVDILRVHDVKETVQIRTLLSSL